jgi:hypothetical protein
VSVFAWGVIAVIGFGVLVAVIVALAVPVADRATRRRGRRTHAFVHRVRS